MPDIDDVYRYWFGDAPAASPDELKARMRRWYAAGPALDEDIRQRFGALVEQAIAGELDSWATTPRGRIALIILLDQFTRNVYRDSPRCYAGDAKAQQLTLEALDSILLYSTEERQFLIMPLLHSEDLALQETGVHEVAEHVASAPAELQPVFSMGIEQSRKYRDIIQKFGRFPHRNALLGRQSTPEEEEFLKDWAQKQPPSGMR